MLTFTSAKNDARELSHLSGTTSVRYVNCQTVRLSLTIRINSAIREWIEPRPALPVPHGRVLSPVA